MRVGTTVPDYEQECFMNGIKLERSEAEQGLGVFIEQDFSFDKHIAMKVNKANFLSQVSSVDPSNILTATALSFFSQH